MKVPKPTDQRIDLALRERLEEIDDDDDYSLNDFEANFVENVLHKMRGAPMTEKQRALARKIVEKYDERSGEDGEDDEP